MTAQRIMNLLFYAIANYIAYIPLVYVPFRNRLRHSKKLTYTVITLIGIGFIALAIVSSCGMPGYFVPIVSVCGAFALMVWGLDAHPGKCATVLLMEFSNASFIQVMAKNAEMMLFPNRTFQLYGWTHSLLILMGVILLALFDYFVTWKVLDQVIHMTHDSRAWNYIWVTPLSFYLVWYIYIYVSYSYRNSVPEKPMILVMLLFLEMGSMATYFTLMRLLSYEGETARLEYQEKINQAQYRSLNHRIEEARKSRHDLRHHFLLLDTMAKEGNLEGVQDYLLQFSEKHARPDVLVYCDHYATNALLSYYAKEAENAEIEFFVKCQLPEETGIPNKDLTIILGNLIENAMNACKKIEDRTAGISINIRHDGTSILIMIKNTAEEAPKKDTNGRYLSSSHAGYGVGLESIKSITEDHHGVMNVEYLDHVFSVSIIIPIEKE